MTPRSWLFVPADAPAKIAKAQNAGADAVILDLEDSVALARKDEARVIAAAALAQARGKPAWGGGLMDTINPLARGSLWRTSPP